MKHTVVSCDFRCIQALPGWERKSWHPIQPPPSHGRHHYEKFPWMLTMLIIHCKVWMAFVSMQNSRSFPWSSLEDVRCCVGTDAFNFFESWSVFKGTGELDYVRGLAGGRCTSVEVDLFWSFSTPPHPCRQFMLNQIFKCFWLGPWLIVLVFGYKQAWLSVTSNL